MNFTEITFPSHIPNKITWGIARFDIQHGSALTGNNQTIERFGRWTCDLTFQAQTDPAVSQELAAFFEQMAMKSNITLVKDFSYQAQGSLSGSPTYTGMTNAKLINTAGWTASATGVLKVGDLIQLATDQLVRVTAASVDADGSGDADIAINPGIRTAPDAASALTLVNPSCYMQLNDDTFLRNLAPAKVAVAGFTVRMIEVIP